ncbi:MAG TPA: NUDIX domain-containing protein [Candidatus Paceibacterota bacterium]
MVPHGGDFASLVFCSVPAIRRTILVYDEAQPLPIYWKFPGGHGEKGETPAQAGSRELFEEVGLFVPPEDLILVAAIQKRRPNPHTLYLFKAVLRTMAGMKVRGDDGERVRDFSLSALLTLSNFHPDHRRYTTEYGLIVPRRGRDTLLSAAA